MKTFAFVDDQDVEVDFPITLDRARDIKKGEVDNISLNLLEDATSRHSALEKSTWTKKRDQAEAYQASGNPADCPALVLEARATAQIVAGGEPAAEAEAAELEALVSRILSQAIEIEALQATVIGWRSGIKRLIEELPTVAAVENFEIVPPV